MSDYRSFINNSEYIEHSLPEVSPKNVEWASCLQETGVLDLAIECENDLLNTHQPRLREVRTRLTSHSLALALSEPFSDRTITDTVADIEKLSHQLRKAFLIGSLALKSQYRVNNFKTMYCDIPVHGYRQLLQIDHTEMDELIKHNQELISQKTRRLDELISYGLNFDFESDTAEEMVIHQAKVAYCLGAYSIDAVIKHEDVYKQSIAWNKRYKEETKLNSTPECIRQVQIIKDHLKI